MMKDERGRAKDGSAVGEEEMWERAEVVLKEKEVVLEKLMARLKAVLGEGRYVNYKGVNGTVNICL